MGPSKTAIFISVAILAPSLIAQTINPLPGWHTRQDGARQILSPADVPAGSFVMTIEPPEQLSGGTFAQWFQNRATAEVARRGGTGSNLAVNKNGDHMLFTSVTLRESVVLFAAVSRSDGTVQFSEVQATPAAAAHAQQHMSEGGRMLAQLIIAAPTAPAQTQAQPPTAASTGAGVTPESVEAVWHDGEGTTTIFGFAYEETVHLLLKDGWEYAGLTKALPDFDVEGSRRAEPKKWHQWRKAADGYEVQVDGKWQKLQGTAVRPLEPQLSARWEYARGYTSGGMGGSVFFRGFTFSSDGRYDRSSSALHSSGALQAAQGASGSVAVSADRQGRSVAGGLSSGTAVTARVNSHTTQGAADMAGTYRVTGYTLELHADSGKVEHLLAFYPDPQSRTSVFIGDSTYLPPGKK